MLAAIEVIGPVLREGETARVIVEADGRNAVGAVGTDTLRFSFNLLASFSFCGEGESSMIRTHPEVSALSLLEFLSEPLSLLRRESMLFRCDSKLVLVVEALEAGEEEEPALVMGVMGPTEGVKLERLILANRRRGTRVWIFCSRFLTRARISDTIWTPLFLAMDPVEDVVVVLTEDVVREAGGFMRVRGLAIEGEEKADSVLDLRTLALDELLRGVTEPLLFRCTSGRAVYEVVTVGFEDNDAFGVVVISFSEAGEISARSKSVGGLVFKRLSLDDDSFSEECDVWRDLNVWSWSLMMEISTLASGLQMSSVSTVKGDH